MLSCEFLHVFDAVCIMRRSRYPRASHIIMSCIMSFRIDRALDCMGPKFLSASLICPAHYELRSRSRKEFLVHADQDLWPGISTRTATMMDNPELIKWISASIPRLLFMLHESMPSHWNERRKKISRLGWTRSVASVLSSTPVTTDIRCTCQGATTRAYSPERQK